MKILFTIHHHLDPSSGAAGVTLKLGGQFETMGHQVQYLSLDDMPKWLNPGLKSVFFPFFVFLKVLGTHLGKEVDVVDASTGDAWLWVLFGKRFFKGPLLVTRSHGLEHCSHRKNLEEAKKGMLGLSWKYGIYHGGIRLHLIAISLRGADLVFQLNHEDLRFAAEKLKVMEDKSYVVPHGLPKSFMGLPVSFSAGDGRSSLTIALIGSYINRKGIKYAVPALERVLIRFPQVKVLFLGTGSSEMEVLGDFSSEVRGRIRVVSRYEHEMLPSLLDRCQIHLFASLSEGFGLTLLESMACGLAPVATKIAGPVEFVEDGENGILIRSSDSSAIEAALVRFITDRKFLKEIRTAAYGTAQQYSLEKCASRQLSLYESGLMSSRIPQMNP
ncbi:MAG: glycosyltransferase family 4 protein [Chitinispirillaceae bacterium]